MLITKLTLPFCLLVTLSSNLVAQFAEVSQGPGYANSIYYDLGSGATTAVEHTAWDIAFNVGPRSSAVLVNEGTLSSRANPQNEVLLYGTTATDFATADTSMITERLHNTEFSWDGGAFNTMAKPEDPFDLGWGSYSPATQTVSGTRVYFVRTRDEVYHKVLIQSLAGGTYTMVHGPVNGISGDTVRITKTDYAGKTLAYFSFADGVKDLEPTDWDLLFTRYTTPLPFEDDFLQYTVTGILHNAGVKVAQVATENPETEPAPTEEAAYADTTDVIGFDWKDVDANFRFFLYDTIAYFVRTPDSLYRLEFIDFTGSSEGTSTFRKEALLATGTTSLPTTVRGSRLYPNPTSDRATLEISLARAATSLRLEVIDPTGRTLSRGAVPDLVAGKNHIEVPLQNLPAGHYFVRLTGSLGTFTHHLVKR
ncbi:MAG: HmuY family protein [Bacteroidota bacterium]